MEPKKTKAKQFCQVCPYPATCQEICPRLEAHLQRRTEDPRKKRINIIPISRLSTTEMVAIRHVLWGDSLGEGEEY